MFNLFVTFREGAFDGLAYELERGRFGEYTSDALMKPFGGLTPAAISKLKSLPCLFVYEAERGSARIGHLTDIRERTGTIFVEYEFDKDIPTFNAGIDERGNASSPLSIRMCISATMRNAPSRR